MGIGRGWRRSLLVAALACTAGCRFTPVRRPDPIADHERKNGSEASLDAPPAASPLPALPPLVPVDDKEAFQATATPTPLLDAAAARAAAIQEIQAHLPDAPILEPATRPDPPTEPLPAPSVDPQVTPVQFEVPSPPAAPPTGTAPPSETVPLPVPVPPQETADEPAVDPWDASLEQLRRLARERQRDGGTEAETWNTRERVLESLSRGQDDSLWEPVAAALASPVKETPPAPEEPDLTILDLKLCRKVAGFGRTEDLSPSDCKPGQQMLIYCELDGLRDEVVDDEFRSRLSAQVEVIRVSDGARVWQADLGEQEDRCRRRRRDFYANYRIQLPADLPAGSYEVKLGVSDRIGKHDAERSVPIAVSR